GQFTGYATEVSVNSLIEREDFANRLKANQSLSLHELLYPVVQALDSVELKTDIEIGGWDQRLNLLTARELQKKLGQKPEVLIMMKGLIGTDGVKKMSKSHNNYIALTETAGQMFGKIMSLKDELIPNYAEMAAGFDEYQVNRLSTLHPKEAKIEVATAIVETYHGKEAAEQARDIFEDTFSSRRVSSTLVEEIDFADFDLPLIQIVTKATASSSSEARRLIEQGGVRINGETVKDQFKKVNLRNKSVQMQIGRHRFFSLLWKKDD
ncbi:MAG: tyrosine--tRNA ligase, partial [Patescibacteria group bacterium]